MSGKRGNSTGTITKRADGRWEARMSLPDGKRKSFYGATYREVERKLAQARRDIEAGLPIVDERQTVEQYLLSWLETVQSQIKRSSWVRYETQIRYHVIPELGKVGLSKLTAQHIQSLYTRLLKSGLSSTTVLHIHRILHRSLKDALRLGLVQRNVSEMVKPPRKLSTDMATLSEEQVKVFLDACKENRFEALYVLALSTGMRRSELLALMWKDIDLEKGILQVRHTLECVEHGKFVMGEPKTAFSKRRIALSKTAVNALRHHLVLQKKERLALGLAWGGNVELVFPNTVGKQMDPIRLANIEFPRLLEEASLPRIRFHDLRHTAATLLLSRGVNVKVVSEMLGHSDISITLRVYGHVMPHMQQGAADIMDSLLGM